MSGAAAIASNGVGANGPSDPGPRVSVIVPAYNRQTILGATLDSVIGQTYRDWELVVVDDGSTDSTLAVADGYFATDPRISVHSFPNGGVATARNRGLQHADPRSEFVVFLDSDDLWMPDTLERLVDALDADPLLVAVHGLPTCVDEHGDEIPGDDLTELKRRRRAQGDRGLEDLALDAPTTFEAFLVDNWTVTPGTCLIRRTVLDRVGPFDPALDPGDDWDFNIRLARTGLVGFLDRPVLRWRKHDDSLTSTSPRWRRAYYGVRDKSLLDPENTPAQQRTAQAVYRSAVTDSALRALRSARRRHYGDAAREGRRAAYGGVRYARAVAAHRLTNLRH